MWRGVEVDVDGFDGYLAGGIGWSAGVVGHLDDAVGAAVHRRPIGVGVHVLTVSGLLAIVVKELWICLGRCGPISLPRMGFSSAPCQPICGPFLPVDFSARPFVGPFEFS